MQDTNRYSELPNDSLEVYSVIYYEKRAQYLSTEGFGETWLCHHACILFCHQLFTPSSQAVVSVRFFFKPNNYLESIGFICDNFSIYHIIMRSLQFKLCFACEALHSCKQQCQISMKVIHNKIDKS